MRFIIIAYIALGFVLSLIVGIEYHFIGNEMMPKYWASPFVYKQESLGSSLERYYSISGIILNISIWSLLLVTLDKLIQKIIKATLSKIIYKVIIAILVVFTSVNILWDYPLIGRGFNENLNYWYWDIDKTAKDWGGKYEGSLKSLKK